MSKVHEKSFLSMASYLCTRMGRIMGIDYGMKRTGLSVTDPLQLIVQGLETCESQRVLEFIRDYSIREPIDAFVVGYPFPEGEWGDRNFQKKLDQFIRDLKQNFPTKEIHLHDERYSSMRAREIMLESGMKRKKRRDKSVVDRTSAIIILQEYLGHI
jgi:putative Holliday junction resolvase